MIAVRSNMPLTPRDCLTTNERQGAFIASVVRILGNPLPDAKSIETFSKAAGINQPSRMRRLILNGHTPSTVMENPTTKSQQHYLTEDDPAAFNSKFMTLRMIAQEYERSWQSTGAELKAKSVTQFSPDGEKYSNLFLREEVQAAF